MNKQARYLSWINAGLVSFIALAAFILSFDAIKALAESNGVRRELSWLFPLIVDGAMIVFSVSVLRASLAGERQWWGWSLIILFTAVSVVFNIAHSNLQVLGMIMAALAPLALLATFETLMSQIKSAVKGSINALANKWRGRARELLGLAKSWREAARRLQAENDSLQMTVDALQGRIENMLSAIESAKQAQKETARLQRENGALQKQVDGLQKLAAYWEHMNDRAQIAARYNAGEVATLDEAANLAGVSVSTISRLANSLNGKE